MRASFFVVAFAAALCPTILSAQTTLTLGTTSLTFGPGSGTGSLVVGANGPWTASTTTPWLHIVLGTQSGSTSGLFEFTYGANLGSTRTGTINFSDRQSVTITQAGASYTHATEFTTLLGSVLSAPAVDSAGNVYFADVGAGAIRKWTAGTPAYNLTTLISIGLKNPNQVAVNAAGNVYIPDTGHNSVKEWVAATGQLVTLASSLNQPQAVAVDTAGNVYIADTGDDAIEKWTAATGQLTTLVSSLNQPQGVAVDAMGNVYIADTGDNLIEKWTAGTGQLTPVVSSLTHPTTLSLDSAGDLFIAAECEAQSCNWVTEEWSAATGLLTILLRGGRGFTPFGVGANSAGKYCISLSIGDFAAGFVGDVIEGLFSGSYQPSPEAVIYSSPSYLTVTKVDSLGNVYFGMRGYVWDGQVEKLTPAGELSVVFADAALPLSSFALGPTGQLYVLDYLGELYQALPPCTFGPPEVGGTCQLQTTFLPYNPYQQPRGQIATDQAGNVYFGNQGLKEWVATTGQIETLIPPELLGPYFSNNLGLIAIDQDGNIYLPDLREWMRATGTIAFPIPAAGGGPVLDGSGDVYFSNESTVEKWQAATGTVNKLFTGPGIAGVDRMGNLYALGGNPDGTSTVSKIVQAFLDATPIVEPLTPGSDSLPPVLPAATPLDADSDQPWLTIDSQNNGVVQFSFTAAGSPRTAHISLLGQTIYVAQTDTTVPTVVSYSVLGGPQPYNLSDSTRTRLPWQITGIRVVFSEPITSGNVTSLNGVTATTLTGLGTNTLTWTIQPVSSGSYTLSLSNSGPNAITDSTGNPLVGDSTQKINVLWGDVNDDGTVNAADLVLISSEFHPTFSNPNPTYDIFADLNGDGVVDAADIQIVRTQIGQTLP